MNKILYITKLCLVLLVVFQFGILKEESTYDASIAFGRQSTDCKGRGVCSFNTSNKTNANASVTLNKDESVDIVVLKNKLSEEDLNMFNDIMLESKNNEDLYFVMDEHLSLSSTLKTELNILNSVNEISEGSHPLVIDENTITITFKLK